MKFLNKFKDPFFAILRICIGLMFAFHGAQKIFGLLSTFQPEMFSQLWFGGILELVLGTLIAVGYRVREVAFLASGMMAVAYVQFHWHLQFDQNFFPAINKGESAVLYCLIFFYMACRGSTTWALSKK